MSSAVNEPGVSSTLEARRVRTVRLIRAGVLLGVGFAIAFSATLHSQFEFDRWMLVISVAVIGATILAEYLMVRQSMGSVLIAIRALVSFGAALGISVASSIEVVAALLAVWAVLTALVSIVRLVRGAEARSSAVPSALLSLALAAAVLVFRDDAVAVIGFFGAYVIVRGVFLGISAFDGPRATGADEHRPALDSPSTTA